MEHVMLYPKIYQTENRNPKTCNEFGKVCAKKRINQFQVKVIRFKVILDKLA